MKRKQSITAKIDSGVKAAVNKRNINEVIVGVSGGADSCALLLSLKKSGINIKAVHCNFHLRGEESMRDRRHVESLCSDLNIPLTVVDFDAAAYAKEAGVSLEMACRDLRYDYFFRLLQEAGYDRVAVGHNADDNVETLLLNLFRGSGVKGMKGMAMDNGKVLRPLLEFSRTEIEQYLKETGVKYVTDSSNLSSDYRRNYIRNELLPAIEQRWKGVKKSITTTIANLQSEASVLNWAAEEWVPDSGFLSLETIASAPDHFWIIYRFASRYGATRDIAVEIADVYEKRAGSQTIVGKKWKAGKGMLRFSMKGLQYHE